MGSFCRHIKGSLLPCLEFGQRSFTKRKGSSVENLIQIIRSNRASLQNLDKPGGAALAKCLKEALDQITIEDVGMQPEDVSRCRSVGYEELYASPDITVCIFLLRTGSVIPLHDHPNMHVFGRLLFGRMHNLAFDAGPGPGITARPSEDEELQAPATFGLGPVESQFHELTAVEPCAFLDIVTPSYNPEGGRNCTFYTVEGREPDGTLRLSQTYPAGFWTDAVQVYNGPAWDL